MLRTYFFSLLIIASGSVSAQKLKKEDRQLQTNLQQHVSFLASDALEGRRTGSAGEKQAADYIAKTFKTIGVTPKGTADYLQPFDVQEGRQVNSATLLMINDNTLVLNKDFFPLVYSGNGAIEAMPSIALQEAQMPWFWDVKELLDENKSNPHFDIDMAIQSRIADMAKKGATAVFLYNTGTGKDGLAFNEKDKTPPVKIPVVYVTKEAATKYLSDASASLDMKLKVDVGPKIRQGHNVIGYIDNGAPTTVVLGAHYDHLGWGDDGNSLYTGATKQIHNGADDNASGTAALLELARTLKTSKSKHNNYLFIAFSGEEQGLFGSKYFVENPTIDLKSVSYMINMDMVGRLNDSSKALTVGGYGTSPVWGQLYNTTGKSKLYNTNLLYRFDSSGMGPSDHTSFYRKDIPVLFYFTGLHSDYHRPSDDFDKLNYTGELYVVKHILSVIEATDKQPGKLAFTKTRDTQTSTNARFSVTLGIMPDYTFGGSGLRVDGVSDGRPASKAGIKAGDVIISLGDEQINSIETYMQALSKFKKGDKTHVTYQRGKESLTANVEF
ncbi:M20/M25/M40 family metallo-hydrolase [Flavisolibacter tropicus]|uniref:M20/M25/M40 family metallo-hydrolase n=1 Tax=Flavisolibacter tropicus TaxID=1492898 RepID=UPI0008363DA0|nr:M20/M25/M40 family metallo-hydrolase [Flavisolibacter tropicus]